MYRPVIVLALLSMLVCGLAFPLAITGIAQGVLPYQANGSQVVVGSKAIGSIYIDNGFTLPVFFHGRNETNPLTSSASGVDPDIPLSDALSQVPRVANATGISQSDLTSLVRSHVQWTIWIGGDPYVNVLELNIALMDEYPSVYSSFG